MSNDSPLQDVTSGVSASSEGGGTSDSFELVIRQIHVATGYDFTAYKRSTIRRRVDRRMALNDVLDYAQYVRMLEARPEEGRRLLDDLLISVTAFFREPNTFDLLAERVIPELVAGKQLNETIRVWVPGCATGEEAYSLAMLFYEAMGERTDLRLQVFATDIDRRGLAFARTGRYPQEIATDVSVERRARYFRCLPDGAYQVQKPLREAIVFAPQNLLTDPPFLRLDLICCRNLMIYLKPTIQPRLLRLFHTALSPGGHLVLGQAENIGRGRDLFEPITEKSRVYCRRAVARRQPSPFPVLAGSSRTGRSSAEPMSSEAVPVGLGDYVRGLVMQEYAPACAVINDQLEVLHLSGPTRRYLHLPEGAPTLNLLTLVGEPARHQLRAAIQKTFKTRRNTAITAAVHRQAPGGGSKMLRMTVRPVNNRTSHETLLLVLFDEAVAPPPSAGAAPVSADDLRDVAHLEHELQVVRDDLQATIDQFEATNEQLRSSNEQVMSMNEELQSANEELETSQEELQSLNEELRSLNSQFQGKISQLEHANDDITNFLASTDLATVFLDTDLCVKRFTPSAARLLDLDENAVGRPINRAIMRLTEEHLLAEAARVLDRLTPVEKEVRTRDGAWYTMRVLPYRTSENRIEGVVLTFSDVTRLRELVDQSERRVAQQALVAELGQRALEGVDLQRLMDEATAGVAQTLDADYTKILELLPGEHELLLRAGAGWKPGMVGHARVSAERNSQAGYTLAANSPVVVDDLKTEQHFSGPPLLHDANVVSGMSVTIQGRHQPFGVFGVHTRTPRHFTREDVNFLQSVANIISQVVARKTYESELKNLNRQLERNVEERTAWLRLMQTTTAAANAASTVKEAVQQVLEQVCRHSGWCLGLAFVPSEDQPDELRLLDYWTAGESALASRLIEAIGRKPIRRGEGLVGRVYQSGQPVWSMKQADEPMMALAREGGKAMKAAIALPVWAGDRSVAVLEFFAAQPVQPDDRMKEVMTQIGTQLGRVVEREQAARHLRESEYFINSVANTAPLMIAVVDLIDDRLVYANSQTQMMLGYTPGQLQDIGPELTETLVHPDDRPAVGALLERMESSPPGTVLDSEWRLCHADGSWRWFAVQVVGFTRTNEGTVRQVLGTLEDITERKRAEDALGESEQRFRAVFECAGLGIGLIQPDGYFAAANPALEAMLGFSEAELRERHVNELTHPDDLGSDLNRCQRVLAGEEEQYEMQKRLLRKDGQPVWVHLHMSLIRDRSEAPLYAIGIVQDITERKDTDKALADLALREQQRIGQDLHDRLGQELTGLSFMAHSLRMQYKDKESPEAENIELLAKGLRRALDDVRAVSRGIFPVEVDARDIKDALQELVRNTHTQYGVTCELHIQVTPPAMDDHAANHLFRIVQEAVRNAIKHAKPERLDVWLRLDAQGRFEVSVEDDGGGVCDADRPVEGIGLRIMRHRASVIGADMSLEPRAEGGTRVKCTFRKT